jgi:hypothetical protein
MHFCELKVCSKVFLFMAEGTGRMAEGKGGVGREYETTRREIEGVEGKVVIELAFISYGCGKNDEGRALSSPG